MSKDNFETQSIVRCSAVGRFWGYVAPALPGAVLVSACGHRQASTGPLEVDDTPWSPHPTHQKVRLVCAEAVQTVQQGA